MAVEHEAFQKQLVQVLAQATGLDKPRRRGAPAIVVVDARPHLRDTIQPGADKISDADAAALQALVRELHQRQGVPFQTAWTLLNQHNGVPSYRLTPARRFAAAAEYLRHWIRTGLPPA
jgi:hypothetical protein